jgi:hypothetical protein
MENIEFKYSDEFDGKKRKLYRFDCICGAVKWLPTAHWKNRTKCSKLCPLSKIIKRELITCNLCAKSFYSKKSQSKNSKSGLRFCSRECKDNAQSLQNDFLERRPSHYGIANGKFGYRDLALKHFEHKCIECNYNNEVIMLDVDHIDDNRGNNKLSNLQFLCVWCHALKTRKVISHARMS